MIDEPVLKERSRKVFASVIFAQRTRSRRERLIQEWVRSMTQSHYPQNPFFVSECLPLRYPFSISFIISSSGLFGKWPISPAVVEIVSNGALMVLSKAFLFRL